jgi:nucleolar complex protein 2
MRFHCIRMLIELGDRTETYIPTFPYVLDILNRLALKWRKRTGVQSSVAAKFDMARLIKVSAKDTVLRAYQDACFYAVHDLFVESLNSVACSVAFPEIVFPVCHQVRKRVEARFHFYLFYTFTIFSIEEKRKGQKIAYFADQEHW